MTSIRRYFAATWSSRTWKEIAYLVLGLPIGLVWFVYALAMYATGISLVIIWVGVPLLVLTHWSMRAIGAFERSMFNSLLDEHVSAPAVRVSRPTGAKARTFVEVRRWLDELLRDSSVWRVVLWVSVRGVLGGVGFTVALLGAIMPMILVAAVIQAILYQVGVTGWWGVDTLDAGALHVVEVSTFWTAVGAPVVLLIAPLFAWASRGTTYVHRLLGRWALGADEDHAVAAANQRADLAEEQLRIDQELHDSIGHMITMNIIQAGAGAHVFDTDPEFSRQALKNIEERGRAAMGELDRIIAAIRGDHHETRAPLAGIDDLERLVEESRAAGMTIDSRLDAPQVAAAVGRAVFTIVRESLTNAARHAPGAVVSVTVEEDGDAIAIEVVNDVPDMSAATIGSANRSGLTGIRDRVALLGGRSHVGQAGGRFAVRALLPLDAALAPEGPEASPWASLRERVTS